MKQLFTNGHIFTSNRDQLYAEAMLVENDSIIWIGSNEEAAAFHSGLDCIDLQGRTIIPGFIDAHMHPMMLAEYSRQIACLPPKINSIKQLQEAVRQKVSVASRDQWILGWGFDEGKYEEKRMPNRYDLDVAAPDNPVFLVRCCEHIRCVNSKALEIAGITAETPDPPGGSIDRDDRGEPTGILRESARDLVIPYLPEASEDEMTDALVDLGKLLTSQGIVAVADMGNLHPGGNLGFFEKAAAKGFAQSVTMYYMWEYFQDDPAFEITEALMDSKARIRIAGLKLIGDGSISGRTAWLAKPYLGTDESGMPVYSDALMESAIAFAKKSGCQVAVHAMGGQAIDRLIDRISQEEYFCTSSADQAPRLRIEHVTEPSEDAMTKAAECGFAFVSQPIFEYCEIETYKANMDEERLQKIYPYRTMLDKGVDLSFSTDAPATSWAVPSDPFANLKSAVTRIAYDGTDIGQSERIDIETAIILYTAKAAQVCGFAELGQLRPGYRADFAVLSEDIFHIEPEQIDRIKVLETWIDGERKYRA